MDAALRYRLKEIEIETEIKIEIEKLASIITKVDKYHYSIVPSSCSSCHAHESEIMVEVTFRDATFVSSLLVR